MIVPWVSTVKYDSKIGSKCGSFLIWVIIDMVGLKFFSRIVGPKSDLTNFVGIKKYSTPTLRHNQMQFEIGLDDFKKLTAQFGALDAKMNCSQWKVLLFAARL